eukprot:scpid91445/ scgid29159/ SID1 transmembrane family member 1
MMGRNGAVSGVLLALLMCVVGVCRAAMINADVETQYQDTVSPGSTRVYFFRWNQHSAAAGRAVDSLLPLRVSVSSANASDNRLLTVLVRGNHGALSWVLPMAAEGSSGTYQNSTRTICPGVLGNSPNGNQTLLVDISTPANATLDYTLRVEAVHDFTLRANERQSVFLSPEVPVYYEYKFAPDDEIVSVRVDADEDQCAIVSVKEARCPVFDLPHDVRSSGLYQTFAMSSALPIQRSNIRGSSFYVVIVSLSGSEACQASFHHQFLEGSGGGIGASLRQARRYTRAAYVSVVRTPRQQFAVPVFALVGFFLAFYVASFLVLVLRFTCRTDRTLTLAEFVLGSPPSADTKSVEARRQTLIVEEHPCITKRRLALGAHQSSSTSVCIELGSPTTPSPSPKIPLPSPSHLARRREKSKLAAMNSGSPLVVDASANNGQLSAQALDAPDDASSGNDGQSTRSSGSDVLNQHQLSAGGRERKVPLQHTSFQTLDDVSDTESRFFPASSSVTGSDRLRAVSCSTNASADSIDSAGLGSSRLEKQSGSLGNSGRDAPAPPALTLSVAPTKRKPQSEALVLDTLSMSNVSRLGTLSSVAALNQAPPEVLARRLRSYPLLVVIVGVFYGIPALQLMLNYQLAVDLTGNQDICYFNFRCVRRLGSFSAFNHVISNLGYVLLGVLFMLLTARRHRLYSHRTAQDARTTTARGLPQHFGL